LNRIHILNSKSCQSPEKNNLFTGLSGGSQWAIGAEGAAPLAAGKLGGLKAGRPGSQKKEQKIKAYILDRIYRMDRIFSLARKARKKFYPLQAWVYAR